MYFEAFKSILLSDTLLSDVFIAEYLPVAPGNVVKIYIYCLFLSKYNKQTNPQELAKKLALDEKTINDSFEWMEKNGLISKSEKDKNILFVDLKEKEIIRLYRPKSTSEPIDSGLSAERNKKRIATINAINNTFFQGVMSPSWYTDIDAWFDHYHFEEEVMYALFKYCSDHKGLVKNYILKVADSWKNKSIVNSFDLDRYSMEAQKLKDIRYKIAKKLKINRNLTEYEEEFVEKWVVSYGYDFSIIEHALKRTTASSSPNFNYLNAILTDWYKKGISTLSMLEEYSMESRLSEKEDREIASKEAAASLESTDFKDIQSGKGQKRQYSQQKKRGSQPIGNTFKQRKYETGYLDSFISKPDYLSNQENLTDNNCVNVKDYSNDSVTGKPAKADTTANNTDISGRNPGIPDSGSTDSINPGIPDSGSTDSINPGIPDSGSTDTINTGTPDSGSTDTINTGTPDSGTNTINPGNPDNTEE